MEAKAHFSAKVYSRKKNKGALQSCMTEEDYSTSSPMKKKKRSHSSSSSSSDDSDFYCNDEDFKCTPSPLTKKSRPKNANPPQNRKKLALPKAPRSVRKNKIAETEKMAANRTEIDVFDSEEDALPCNSRKNLGFEMLVEAAAVHKDRGHPSALFSASSDRNVRSNAKEETKIGESSHETERDNYSIYEDERDNEENENYANESDGLEKTSQPHLPIIFEQNKSDFIASHAKKVRSKLASQRTNSVSESIHSAKSTITINEENDKAPELSPAGSPQTERDSSVGEPNKEPGKYVVTKRKTCGKSVSASLLSKITEKLTTEATGVRRVPLGLTGTRALLKSNVVSSAENNSSASGCSNVPRSQASSAPHQRVIGLSRRVRPPPLHPYLSKSNK